MLIYFPDNVKSLVQDVEGTKDIISEMAKMKDVLCNMKADDEENNPNAGNKDEPAADIDHKIRSTRKVFKELKTFLGEFLNRIDPVEGTSGGNLGMLVQKLWDQFQNEKEEYVQLSHLVRMFLIIKYTIRTICGFFYHLKFPL